MELLVVLLILAALAGLVIPLFGGVLDNARHNAAEESLRRVQEAIVGKPNQPGYLADMGRLPHPGGGLGMGLFNERVNHPQLRYLFVNPSTESALDSFDPNAARGWRGPYILSSPGQYEIDLTAGFTTDFGEPGDPAVFDPWGRPLVIDAVDDSVGDTYWMLISAGANRALEAGGDPASDDVRVTLQRIDE